MQSRRDAAIAERQALTRVSQRGRSTRKLLLYRRGSLIAHTGPPRLGFLTLPGCLQRPRKGAEIGDRQFLGAGGRWDFGRVERRTGRRSQRPKAGSEHLAAPA